jgi:2-oxoglutarate ferredoxin oxidoreductase subunit alpha
MRVMRKIENNKEDIWMNEEHCLDDAEVVIFAYGSTARSARFAVNRAREKGQKVGLLRPLTLWPFPETAMREAVKGAKAVIVPELNLGQMVYEVERCSPGIEVEGIYRVDGGAITPAQILEVIDKYA